MQVHIQNDGPVTIELESPAPGAATSDPKQVRPESEMGCLLAASNFLWLQSRSWSSSQSEVEKMLYCSDLEFT